MSGHSKWSTIKRKKEKTDGARAKVFTKIGREIAVAVREGGPDPAGNSKLKDVIAKAKANNVPNENIERIIKKAAGDTSTENYENIVYEGYGPAGIAVVVEALTDNRNRTAGDVRHYFDKFGGNMGTSGCVMFMFDRFGVIIVEKDGVDEEKLMEAVKKVFDLRPREIIKALDLRKPIYEKLAAYGHMGREDLGVAWEKCDKVEELKAAIM